MPTPHLTCRASFTRYIAAIICAALLLALAAVVARAQSGYDSTPAGLAPGTPAGSYALSSIDNVNLFNGNLQVYLPLLNVAGRGGARAPVGMIFDSPAHWAVTKYTDLNGSPAYGVGPDTSNGGTFSGSLTFGAYSMYITRSTGELNFPCNPTYPTEYPSYWQYTLLRLHIVEPDGTEHDMRDVLTGGQKLGNNGGCNSLGPSRGKVFVSTDGSGMTYVADDVIRDGIYVDYPEAAGGGAGGWLFLKDGRRYRIDNTYGISNANSASKMLDRNGNTIT